MKTNKEDSCIHELWNRMHYWIWKKIQKNTNQIYMIKQEERKDYRKNLGNPFPKGAKSPRVYKFYWSGY
jgi:hypothetical protein